MFAPMGSVRCVVMYQWPLIMMRIIWFVYTCSSPCAVVKMIS